MQMVVFGYYYFKAMGCVVTAKQNLLCRGRHLILALVSTTIYVQDVVTDAIIDRYVLFTRILTVCQKLVASFIDPEGGKKNTRTNYGSCSHS